MKKVLLLAALALGYVGANAQRISVEGNVVDGKATLSLRGNKLTTYRDVEFNIYLPEGMSIVTKTKTEIEYDEDENEIEVTKEYIFTDGAALNIGHAFAQNPQEDGSMKVVIANTAGNRFKPGVLGTFDVVTNSSYKGGDIKVTGLISGDEGAAPIETLSNGVVVKVENQFATVASPFDIALPAGLQAYDATVSGKEVVLSNASSTVTAGKPAIITGAQVDQCVYGFATATESANGDLVGVYEPTEITSGYVLSGDKFQSVSTSATVPAYKAYLNTTSEIKGFRFADDATAINGVNNAAAGVKGIYGVNGAARSSMVKGVNIIKNADGSVSKVLVK